MGWPRRDARVPNSFTEIPVKVRHFSDILHIPVVFSDHPEVDIFLGRERRFDAFRIRFGNNRAVFELQAAPA